MDYIIILGSSDLNVCHKRCEIGAEYFKKNCIYKSEEGEIIYLAKIICSGGCDNWGLPEAEYMNNVLIDEMNILDCNIAIENKSQNTEENFLYCRKMFINSKMIGSFTNDNWVKSIIICTSSSHIKRAFVIALNVFEHDDIGPIKTIHTNEPIPDDVCQNERLLLDDYLDRKLFFNTQPMDKNNISI